MRGMIALLLAAALSVPVLGQPAAAEAVRPTLPAQTGSTHFVVHYDPSTADGSYVGNALADLEEAYSRLVAGGGGVPNAGLRPPVNDAPRGGDGRTDIYLTTPPGQPPTWTGGQEWSDGATYADPLVDSGFVFMSPGMSRTAFRFRSAHEFMHVVQDAYIDTAGLLTESTANWASDFALPDIEPGDSQFTTPFLPLDCSYGSWNGQACGNGYRQWLYVRWLSERFGDGFVHRLWTVHATSFPIAGTSPAIDRQILSKAITDEPGDATLASTYGDYAAAVWDPTLWTTTAVQSQHYKYGPPVTIDAGLSRASPTIGPATVKLDHLAAQYVRIQQAGASAPADRVHVTVTPGSGAAPGRLLSATGPGLARSSIPMTASGTGVYEATVSLDAAAVADVILPLINTSTTDGVSFTYSAELLPAGVATPPPNDERRDPSTVQAGTTTVEEIAYAGGLGADEAPDCDTTRRSRGGVWFSLLVGRGGLTVDTRASDFDAAVAVYDVTVEGEPSVWGCSTGDSRGVVTGDTFARQYLIYIGRSATSGPGHTLRLRIDGVPNSGLPGADEPLPEVTGLKISPKRFHAAKKGPPVKTGGRRDGARLSFAINVPAGMRFTIEQRLAGHRAGGRCVVTTVLSRAGKKCVRYRKVSAATLRGFGAGPHTLTLTGRRSASKALAPGAYRLGAQAIDQFGTRSPRVTRPFTITR